MQTALNIKSCYIVEEQLYVSSDINMVGRHVKINSLKFLTNVKYLKILFIYYEINYEESKKLNGTSSSTYLFHNKL